MSTYYYAVCHEHKVRTGVIAGRSFPQRWWDEDDSRLGLFLAEHAECDRRPVIVSEHTVEADEYAKFEPAHETAHETPESTA